MRLLLLRWCKAQSLTLQSTSPSQVLVSLILQLRSLLHWLHLHCSSLRLQFHDGIDTSALAHRLSGNLLHDLLSFLLNDEQIIGGVSLRLHGLLRGGVFDLHDSVVDLRSVELLDSLGGRGGLGVNQSGRTQILPEHVPVEKRRN